ncbi:MAG TPA: helix-turn-helix domain-containing protein [Jatrophihabitantaceae bacterium]|jgi:DNA-binding transcriptional ArsR family regulator
MPREKKTPPDLRRVTDPQTLRALSHPVRLALLEVLTVEGPLTATRAGELLGESPTTCSFHLRQLAKYGFVVEAGGGPGRTRPWKLAHLGWTTDSSAGDAAAGVASDALGQLTLQRYVDRHDQRTRTRDAYPVPWRGIGEQSQTVWWVTPSEAADLQDELRDLFFRFRERLLDPSTRPAGSGPVEVVAFTHLFSVPDGYADPDPAG